ncbi:expressed unknown protein [Seminavis robusta]|uniref:Uncharacterized protein n=1 Tax=Seminavis robusta TaxID=568900 RepID=A0A9N8ESI2_9STRA|nr:expressed unknown protein [Seminavis robusta]|eukprot:Sro1830_g300290.1 n/a (2086) ;mRNA; f:1363-7620
MTTSSTSKRIRSRRCICDDARQCQGMSLAFQMLHDPRGGFVDVPPACSSPPEYEYLHRQYLLRRAYLRHLQPRLLLRTTTTSTSSNHSDDSDEEFVALHHFHPKVVRKVFAETATGRGRSLHKYQVPLTLTPREIQKLRLTLESVSSEKDRVTNVNGQPQDEFFFVPHYPMADAYEDLKQLSRAERSPHDISTDVYQNAKKAAQAQKEQQQLQKQKEKELRRKKKAESKKKGKKTSPKKNREPNNQQQRQQPQHQNQPRNEPAIAMPQPQEPKTASDSSQGTHSSSNINNNWRKQPIAGHSASESAFAAADNHNNIRRPDGFDLTAVTTLDSNAAVAGSSRIALDVSDRAVAGSFKKESTKPAEAVDNNNNKRHYLTTDLVLSGHSDEAIDGSNLILSGHSGEAVAGSTTNISMVLSGHSDAATAGCPMVDASEVSFAIEDLRRRRRSSATTNNNNNSMDISNTTVVSGKPRKSSFSLHGNNNNNSNNSDLGASDSAVVLYGMSASSLQVTDPAFMHASATGSSFHASDVTQRASGGKRINNMDVSDSTIPTSNVAGARRSKFNSSQDVNWGWGSTLSAAQIAEDIPMEVPEEEEPTEVPEEEEEPTTTQPTSTQLPVVSSDERPPLPTKRAKSLVHAQVAMEMPQETLPRRKSDFVQASPMPDDMMGGRSHMVIVTKDSPPMKRKSMMRDSIRSELVATIPESSVLMPPTTTNNPSVAHSDKDEMDVSASDMRFTSSPMATSRKMRDMSPSTPKRVLSVRNIQMSDELEELAKLDSMKKLEDDSSKWEESESKRMSKSDGDVLVRRATMDTMGQSSRQNKEFSRRRSAPLRSNSDSSGVKEMSSCAQDGKVRRFHSAPRRTRSGSHHHGQRRMPSRTRSSDSVRRMPLRTRSSDGGAKRMPPRTRSSDSVEFPRLRRWSYLSSSRSKSDDSRRRRSDSSVFSSWGSEGSKTMMSDMSGKSKLGATRRIDNTKRAMQQYCDFQRSETTIGSHDCDARVPRRLRDKPSRTRSTSPARPRSESPCSPLRRGRRTAIVATNGDELFKARTKRMPRRTKSVDSSMDASFSSLVAMRQVVGKRVSDPSPTRSRSKSPPPLMRANTAVQNRSGTRFGASDDGKKTSDPTMKRSLSPGPALRRAQTVDTIHGTRSRHKSRALATLQEKKVVSLSPRRSPSRTKSELSPTVRRGNRQIKRIDSSLRAMKQFVHDNGTASDFTRTRSRNRLHKTRSMSPKRCRSSAPEYRVSPTLGGSTADMDMSSSDAVGHDSEENAGISMPEMNASSPAALGDKALRVRCTGRSGSCPAQAMQIATTRTAEAINPDSIGSSTKHSSVSSDGAASAHSRSDSSAGEDARPSVVAEIGELHKQTSVKLQDLHEETINDAETGQLRKQPSVRLEDLQQGNSNDAKSASEAQPVDASFRIDDLNAATADGHQSMNLDALKPDYANGIIPAGFNFSFPRMARQDRKKEVDWESLGFCSTSTLQVALDDEKSPMSFGLPRRLVAKKFRQQLLSEVVVTAHRRQSIVAKRTKEESAKRRDSEIILKEIVQAVKKVDPVSEEDEEPNLGYLPGSLLQGGRAGNLDFDDDEPTYLPGALLQTRAGKADDEGPSYLPGALTKVDKAGKLNEGASRQISLQQFINRGSSHGSLEQGSAHVSLSIEQVFTGGKDTKPSQRSSSETKLPKSAQNSSMSLTLSRVFEESEEITAKAASKDAGCELDESGCMEREKLRTVFPFRNIKEKKRDSPHSSGGETKAPHVAQDQKTTRPEQHVPNSPRSIPLQHVAQDQKTTRLVEQHAPNSLKAVPLPPVSQDQKTTRPEQQVVHSSQSTLLPNIREGDTEANGDLGAVLGAEKLAAPKNSEAAAPKKSEAAAPKKSEAAAPKKSEAASVQDVPPPLMPITAKQPPRQSPVEENVLLPQSEETSRSEQKAGAMRMSSTRFNPPDSFDHYSTTTCASSSHAVVAELASESSSSSMSTWSKSGSNGGSKASAPDSPFKEFHLSFPPAQATASRTLPTPELCMSPRPPNKPRARSMFPTTNGTCTQTNLDQKIGAMDAPVSMREIKFTPLFDYNEKASTAVQRPHQKQIQPRT